MPFYCLDLPDVIPLSCKMPVAWSCFLNFIISSSDNKRTSVLKVSHNTVRWKTNLSPGEYGPRKSSFNGNKNRTTKTPLQLRADAQWVLSNQSGLMILTVGEDLDKRQDLFTRVYSVTRIFSGGTSALWCFCFLKGLRKPKKNYLHLNSPLSPSCFVEGEPSVLLVIRKKLTFIWWQFVSKINRVLKFKQPSQI